MSGTRSGTSLKDKILWMVEERGIVSLTNKEIAKEFEYSNSNYVSKQVNALISEGKIVTELTMVSGVGYRRLLKAPNLA